MNRNITNFSYNESMSENPKDKGYASITVSTGPYLKFKVLLPFAPTPTLNQVISHG